MARRELALAATLFVACRSHAAPTAPHRDDSFVFRATSVDTTLPDVDALGYDIALGVAGAPGEEAFAADVKGTYVATRDLAELSLDFDGHDIDDLRIDDHPARFRRDGTQLVIAAAVASGQSFTSRVRYHGVVQQADRANQNDLSTFGGFYVREQNLEKRRIFSTLGWPSSARRWLPLRDHPRDGAMVVMTLTFPENLTVLANGRITSFVNNGNGTSTWRYEALTPMPPYDFHVSAYDDWQLGSANSASGVPVQTYLYVASKAQRESALGELPKALDFYEAQFGRFRWNSATFIEEPIFGGGMENATVVSLDETLFKNEAASTRHIAVHELAHHWSGNLVRIRRWNDFWLSEGFTEYLAGRYLESTGEKEVWKKYRDTALAADEKASHAVCPDGDVNVLSIFDGVSYQKGALVLRMLEQRLGKDAFTKFLAGWFERHAFGAVTTEDFERELQASTSHDLGGFFRTFVHSAFHPELRVTLAKNGDVTIDQTQTKGPEGGFVFWLEVNGELVPITSRHVVKHVQNATVDPEGYLLGTFTNILQP